MGAAVAIRTDMEAGSLRRLARRERDDKSRTPCEASEQWTQCDELTADCPYIDRELGH